MDDQTYVPDNPAAYLLTFRSDGTLDVRADCNRGHGTWTHQAPSGLELGPIAATRMACPPGSLHDRFLRDLGYVRSFVLRDGLLYLATMADGAILELAPIEESAGSTPVAGTGPSFDCDSIDAGSTESIICGDPALGAQDRKLAAVYEEALRLAPGGHSPTLRAEQRGWIKGRDQCRQAADPTGCIRNRYQRRIAELQARYRLVEYTGPVTYVCDGDSANRVTATYFATDPPTLVAEHGGSLSLMYRQPAASGTKYQGPGGSIWEHQGEAMINWGYDAPSMRCEKSGSGLNGEPQ